VALLGLGIWELVLDVLTALLYTHNLQKCAWGKGHVRQLQEAAATESGAGARS
jgi:hypothetical protein